MANMSKYIHLNVGGVFFSTYASTVCSRDDTLFAGLVRHDEDGDTIFVDRDPTYFRHVLNWFRGVRYLPDDDAVLQELLWEADYFNLTDMVLSIQKKLASKPANLNKTLLAIRDELRQR